MSDVSTFYDRNESFKSSFTQGDLVIAPRFKTLIICCVDARVDPAHFLALELGDALVMRTVGARLTDAAITEAAMLYWLMYGASDGAVKLGIALIGHNDCGMERLTNPAVAAQFAARVGQDVVDAYAIANSEEVLLQDLARLMSDPRTPDGMTATVHMYDVTTGSLSTVEGS